MTEPEQPRKSLPSKKSFVMVRFGAVAFLAGGWLGYAIGLDELQPRVVIPLGAVVATGLLLAWIDLLPTNAARAGATLRVLAWVLFIGGAIGFSALAILLG